MGTTCYPQLILAALAFLALARADVPQLHDGKNASVANRSYAEYYVFDPSYEALSRYPGNLQSFYEAQTQARQQIPANGTYSDTIYLRPAEQEHIECENDWTLPENANATEFTVSAWIAIGSRHGKKTLISKYCEENDGGVQQSGDSDDNCTEGSLWSVSIIAGYVQAELSILKEDVGIVDFNLVSTSQLSLNEWHNLAITCNSSYVSIYIDGQENALYELQSIRTEVPRRLSRKTTIGNTVEAFSDSFFGGLISSMFVWDISLGHDQIHSLYERGLSVAPDRLLAQYMWNEQMEFANAVSGNECRIMLRPVPLAECINESGNTTSNATQEGTPTPTVRVGASLNVKIEPEIPPQRLYDEGLLELKGLYQNDSFLPIHVAVTDTSLLVTAMGTGVWQFDYEYQSSSDDVSISDEPKLVVASLQCGQRDGTNSTSYKLCLNKHNVTLAMSSTDLRNSFWQQDISVLKPIQPFGIETMSNGSVLISDVGAHVLWIFDPESKRLELFAGTGKRGYLDGPAGSAELDGPTSIVSTKEGTVFLADTWNHCIRKIENGMVSTLAGNPGVPGYIDSPNNSLVMFNGPFGLSLSLSEETIFVADTHNHVIRQVSVATGSTATLAGTLKAGFVDGIGPLAKFGSPIDIAPVPWSREDLFVADFENAALRRVNKYWSDVRTPPQMIADIPDYTSARKDIHTWNGVKWSATLKCIQAIAVKPTYGIKRLKNVLILSDTEKGALEMLKNGGTTFRNRLKSCTHEQKKRSEVKVIIAASVSSVVLLMLLAGGMYFLAHQYKKKKDKLTDKENTFKKYMHTSLLESEFDDGSPSFKLMSTSPLEQALEFLNEYIHNRKPNQKRAEQVRKMLICGALMNGDVSKPLDLYKNLSSFRKMEGSYLSQVVSSSSNSPALRKKRSRKRWHRTWNAYQAANMFTHTTPKIPESGTLPSFDDLQRRDSARVLLSACKSNPQIDLFELDEKTEGHPLLSLSLCVFHDHELFSSLPIDEKQFSAFVSRVEGEMGEIPYHNKIHVAGVLHAMHFFIVKGGLGPYLLDEYEVMSCLTAAIIHDFQHPGVNNDFLIATQHNLALTYNDASPLENFHLSSAFSLLQNEEELDFMSRVPFNDQKTIRESVIRMVLATDMARHFEIVNQGKLLLSALEARRNLIAKNKHKNKPTSHQDDCRVASLLNRSGDGNEVLGEAERAVIIEIVMKCADLYHVYQPFKHHKKWGECIMEEFCQQGDKERLLGRDPVGLFDRESLLPYDIAKNQVAFMNIVVIPLFELLSQLLPETASLLDQIYKNRNTWVSRMREVSRSLSDKSIDTIASLGPEESSTSPSDDLSFL